MSAKQTAASIQNQKFKAKLSSSFQYKKKETFISKYITMVNVS